MNGALQPDADHVSERFPVELGSPTRQRRQNFKHH